MAILEQALSVDDPLTVLRRDDPSSANPDPYSPDQQRANARAAAVIATFTEFGEGEEFSRIANEIIQADDGVSPLIIGLTNIAVIYASMLAQALGTTPQSLLGGFTEG